MSYFKNFPKIAYDMIGDNKSFIITTNIFKRLIATKNILSQNVLFDLYDIKDGETPELVAEKFYDDPNLYWVILLANNIKNPFYNWPLTSNELLKFTQNKYENNLSGIHHFENSNAFEVLSTDPGAVAITNIDFENKQNENNRSIKILRNEFLDEFVVEFNEKIQNE